MGVPFSRDGGNLLVSGVPLCVFEGEPFFGQDRLALLQRRLEQRGVPRR